MIKGDDKMIILQGLRKIISSLVHCRFTGNMWLVKMHYMYQKEYNRMSLKKTIHREINPNPKDGRMYMKSKSFTTVSTRKWTGGRLPISNTATPNY